VKSDLKKHELLKILSAQRQNSKTPVGVPFEDILRSMDIDKEYLDEISGELFGFDEIGFFEDSQYKKGLHARKEGVSSYSSKKYIKRYKKDRWENRKNWVQTYSPILSLVLAIMALSLTYSNIPLLEEQRQKELEKRIKKIEYQIKGMEFLSKNTQIDSLNIE